MPCPHNEISIVQRSQQQSAVAAAAYQSGEKLFCEYDQEVKHYPEKRGSASLAGRIHRTAFRRFGKQRRQQQTGGCYAGRWRFDCVDRAFSVPPFRF